MIKRQDASCIKFYAFHYTYIEDYSQFLLSNLSPHKPFIARIIGGWTKKALSTAGIDVSIFTAHSARLVLTLKDQINGLSVSDILKRGNCLKNSTWQKHYNNVILNGENYQPNKGLSTALN